MVQKTFDRIVNTITVIMQDRKKRMDKLTEKMNENYEWFFLHRSIDMFILTLEVKHLDSLLKRLQTTDLQGVEEFLDIEEHFYLQKLVSDPVTVSTNVEMVNLAHVHERTVSQRMYNIIGKLKSIVETENK